MTPPRGQDFDQKLIDHEVRVSKAREAGEVYAAGRDSWQELQSNQADRRWYRGELVAMLAAARSEADLLGLGLSDDTVREARLGESLLEAWTRFRPRHHPLPDPERTTA